MDGGAVYGGVLHGLMLDDSGITEHFYVPNDGLVAED